MKQREKAEKANCDLTSKNSRLQDQIYTLLATYVINMSELQSRMDKSAAQANSEAEDSERKLLISHDEIKDLNKQLDAQIDDLKSNIITKNTTIDTLEKLNKDQGSLIKQLQSSLSTYEI